MSRPLTEKERHLLTDMMQDSRGIRLPRLHVAARDGWLAGLFSEIPRAAEIDPEILKSRAENNVSFLHMAALNGHLDQAADVAESHGLDLKPVAGIIGPENTHFVHTAAMHGHLKQAGRFLERLDIPAPPADNRMIAHGVRTAQTPHLTPFLPEGKMPAWPEIRQRTQDYAAIVSGRGFLYGKDAPATFLYGEGAEVFTALKTAGVFRSSAHIRDYAANIPEEMPATGRKALMQAITRERARLKRQESAAGKQEKLPIRRLER